MSCRIYTASSNELWARQPSGGGGGGVSLESEYDLAIMVNDFLENGNSVGTGSRYSSDTDSSLSDIVQLANKISDFLRKAVPYYYVPEMQEKLFQIFDQIEIEERVLMILSLSILALTIVLILRYFKLVMDRYESDLLSMVNSLALSINERDLYAANSGLCNASCIRFSLVKLLRVSGYDAGVCTSRWQGIGKVPGGDHEYIDVVCDNDTGTTKRLIIDIDFRSHFEIARAVDSYERILNSLPVIYVGSFAKLKQFLQVMVEAAKSSLKQNSMPLPPWRSLAYLQAKWQSPYHRKFDTDKIGIPAEQHKCGGHLKRLHSLLLSEIKVKRMLRPFNCDKRMKVRRQRHPTFQ